MKIKTFEFCVNCSGGAKNRDSEYEKDGFDKNAMIRFNVKTPEEIDTIVNNWLSTITASDFIDMKDYTYTSIRHNNGRQDTIIRVISIIYKD